MKKKSISIFIVIIVLVAVCAVGAGLVSAAQKPTAVIPYEEMLSKTTSPYAETDLAESSAAYLLNADFDVTADNFYQSFYDFLAAPARLYYADNYSPWYKCDAPEINVKFAEVFKDLILYEVSAEEFNSVNSEGNYAEYYLQNELGNIKMIFYPDPKTYVAFEREDDTIDCFCIDVDLSYGVDYAKYEVLDYSMEAPASET